MKAQRMIGNAVMAAETLANRMPVSWRVGAVSVHTKSDGTFDVVAPANTLGVVIIELAQLNVARPTVPGECPECYSTGPHCDPECMGGLED